MTRDSVPEVIGNQTYKPDISQGQCALPFRRNLITGIVTLLPGATGSDVH